MKITKRQLRRIIKEEKARLRESYLDDVGGDLGAHVIDYLRDQARSYHADPSLDVDGDGKPDPVAIKTLLHDDFMDNFGHEFDVVDFNYEIDTFAHGGDLHESNNRNNLMKITNRQLRRIIREEKVRIQETVPGPDGGSIRAARESLNRALAIFERMGYYEAADYVVAAIESLDYPEGIH